MLSRFLLSATLRAYASGARRTILPRGNETIRGVHSSFLYMARDTIRGNHLGLFLSAQCHYSTSDSDIPSTLVVVDKAGKKLDPYDPAISIASFEDLPRVFGKHHVPEFVRIALKKNNYVKPTIIQRFAIPLLMKGGDLIALAPTGTGKTLAFGLPCVSQINMDVRKPQLLVLCPTRELAQQTAAVFEKVLGDEKGIVVGMAYGGEPKFIQKNVIARCHVLIATPGRLNDFLRSRDARLDALRFVVMDEADRLLDMGFAPQISEIMENVPKQNVQVMMFSATWDQAVQGLAEKYISENYFIVSTGAHQSGASANFNITQAFTFVNSPHDREKEFIDLYQKGIIKTSEKVIAFVERKSSATTYANAFRARLRKLYGVDMDFVDDIHGDKDQEARTHAINNFKKGKTNVLIATDIVARGIDVPDVMHVVNVEMPRTFDSYVHRIGRTGRAGLKGSAHSFIETKKDAGTSKELIEYLGRCKQPVPDSFHSMAQQYEQFQEQKNRRFGGGRKNSFSGGGRSGGGAGRSSGGRSGGYDNRRRDDDDGW